MNDDSLVHVIARACRLPRPLTDPEVAPWLWRRLRQTFPDAQAAVLMPGHSHVATPGHDVRDAKDRMAHLLSGLRRSHNPGADITWERVERPEVVVGARKAARLDRYIVLNPSRAGLVADPLEWAWSTHRDVVGAVADPWVDAARLARSLGRPQQDFAAWWHGYVSGDPSVAVAGTPSPIPSAPTTVPSVPLARVLLAAAAATRGLACDVVSPSPTRQLFLQLAWMAGWRDLRLLARVCNLTAKGVYRSLRRGRGSEGLEAAALCLGDPRLIAHLERPWDRAVPEAGTLGGDGRLMLPPRSPWGNSRRG